MTSPKFTTTRSEVGRKGKPESKVIIPFLIIIEQRRPENDVRIMLQDIRRTRIINLNPLITQSTVNGMRFPC